MNELPIGGTTGHDHESSAAIDEAAAWLAKETSPPHPIIPAIRSRFGLSAIQAVTAIREAHHIRGRT